MPRSSLRYLAAGAALTLGVAPAAAQSTPTPQLLQQAGSQCPADARIKYDVTSLPGADGIRWQLRRGTPGSVPTWGAAEQLGAGQLGRPSGNKQLALRGYGATLDGTPYLARIRATQDGQPIAGWSEPASYAPSLAPTSQMFSAAPLTSGGSPQLQLGWNLGGGLAACADRVRFEIKKGSPFSSPTAPDVNTTMAETFPGISGARLLPVVTGSGDYWVRILARYGGDTPDNDVGRRSPALKVTISPPVTTYALDVTIVDAAASACANSAVGRRGATAKLTGSNGSWTRTADAEGRVRFTVAAGNYTLEASHQGCTSAQAQVWITTNDQRTVTLGNCDAARSDLAVALGGDARPVGGRTYAMPITVRNVGTARSPAGQITLHRASAAGGAPRRLHDGSLPPVCPGQSRTFATEDPGPVAGETYSYTARATVADGNTANNVAIRRVGFSYQLVAAQPIAPSPAPVAISSFAIRNGLPYVTLNRTVPLTVSASGSPTEYRAALRARSCATTLAAAPWRAWSASAPPTWSFSRTGEQTLCFQLRRGSGDGAVASSPVEDAIVVVEPGWVSRSLGTTATPVGAPAVYPAFHSLSCEAKFAVGLDVKAGQYVDAMALRCADLGAAGEHSNASTTGFVGGSGGERINLRCRSGEVLSRVDVRYGIYVDRVEIHCAAWRRNSGAAGTTRYAGAAGGAGGNFTRAACPAPLAVTRLPALHTRGGILPGTGPYLAAFQVSCAVPPGL